MDELADSVEKINIDDSEPHSYYQEYNTELDFSPGVINMYGYCRVSTQIQAQFGSSIDTQQRLLENESDRSHYDELNKNIRYHLMRIYIDDGISAKNITDRPGLVNVMDHISSLVNGRTHQKIGLIVSDLSRLTRSSADLETILEWVKNDAIKLTFVDNSIDTTTNAGMLMLKMMTNYFEFERKNSSFKTTLTLRSMSENGTLPGGCSYGWTCTKTENGRKADAPVEAEQEGYNKVIELIGENPDLKAFQIKNLMNETGIICLRGPGKNFRGNEKPSEKDIARNAKSEWTGKWTTAIIQKIMDRVNEEERRKTVMNNSEKISILDKDARVIEEIKQFFEETDGYSKERVNVSEVCRYIDDKQLFVKKVNRQYITKLMLDARLLPKEDKKKKTTNQEREEEIIESIRTMIEENKVRHFTTLTEKLIENNIELVGKRKAWNKTNVRDLCKQKNIELYTEA